MIFAEKGVEEDTNGVFGCSSKRFQSFTKIVSNVHVCILHFRILSLVVLVLFTVSEKGAIHAGAETFKAESDTLCLFILFSSVVIDF